MKEVPVSIRRARRLRDAAQDALDMEVDWHLTGKTGANSAARKRELDEAANDYLDNHAQWEQSRGLVGTRS